MYKWTMLTLIIVSCLVGIGVLLSDVNESAKQRAAAEQEAKTPQLRITATNWKFDQEVYNVKLGETLKVSLQNAEGVHAVEITGYNVKLDATNSSTEVTFDKPGEYEIFCTLLCGEGHAEMRSKLIVE
mgnify:CR=1 FL=1